MNKLLAILAASAFALGSATALAADPPKDPAKPAAEVKLVKPASVTQEAWDKMSDADKKKAMEKAKPATTASGETPKKKKGGC
jgi:hypothetical protein